MAKLCKEAACHMRHTSLQARGRGRLETVRRLSPVQHSGPGRRPQRDLQKLIRGHDSAVCYREGKTACEGSHGGTPAAHSAAAVGGGGAPRNERYSLPCWLIIDIASTLLL